MGGARIQSLGERTGLGPKEHTFSMEVGAQEWVQMEFDLQVFQWMRGMEHLQSGGLCQGRENWGQGVKRLEGDSKRVMGVIGKRIYTGKVKKKVSSLQFIHSVVSNSLRPQLFAACQAALSITNSRSLLKLKSIESVMPSNYLILCHPLLLLPSIFPSIRVFSNESSH